MKWSDVAWMYGITIAVCIPGSYIFFRLLLLG